MSADQARRDRGRATSRPDLACPCRACVAKSLARALRQIDKGRPLVAADIVICSILDLTENAIFVTTGPGKKAPLCERDPRHKAARMFQVDGVELVEGRS